MNTSHHMMCSVPNAGGCYIPWCVCPCHKPVCTDTDHDTTDFYCGACGTQLHENRSVCDYCDTGQHDTDGHPFCRCCGSMSTEYDTAEAAEYEPAEQTTT